ncbi:MAG: PIG-L family deacetylase, partial [Phycisphaerae bacterium]|nr:PIG-L family deacetylase [Gemmatimonadaceae bacterium]
PDDEDTQLIAWLARGRHVETAYLSLTRGDGGQNIIGNDLGEALGIIRTEELLSARRIDGGRQFFTRAYDFGFSKNAEETLRQWPRDTVMGDVIRVVRAFRPQVIVAVFSGTPADGHGHHQVSGILARDAYDLSADTLRYPVAIFGSPWTTSKFYRRVRTSAGATTKMNVGEYNPLIGRSYAEIAADSRSQHKSQGFGVLQQKGATIDQIGLEASRVNDVVQAATEGSIFAGIDTTWNRLRARSSRADVQAALDSANAIFRMVRDLYRPNDPSPLVEPLSRAVRLLRVARVGAGSRPWILLNTDLRYAPTMVDELGYTRLGLQPGPGLGTRAPAAPADAELWNGINVNLQRAERALVMAAGVAVETFSPAQNIPVVSPLKTGVPDTVPVNVVVHNRGRAAVHFVSAAIGNGRALPVDVSIAPDSTARVVRTARAAVLTAPWWRAISRNRPFFLTSVDSRDEAQRAEAQAIVAKVRLDIAEVSIDVMAPVVNRFADPIKGEQLISVAGVPGISVGLDRLLEYIRAGVPVSRQFKVNVQSVYSSPETVSVSLRLPPGLVPDSAVRTRVLTAQSPSATLTFTLKGSVPADRYVVHAIATHKGQATQAGFAVINYDHINVTRVQTASSMWLTAVQAVVPARVRVAYIQGVGDIGWDVLRQLDVNAEKIDPSAIPTTDFSKFTAVVVGPRAYAASDALVENNPRLLEYARKGGTLIVQYGQQEMMSPGIMPYPIQLARTAERVTVENAAVTVLSPTARLLNSPNRIVPSDWEDWAQERALYMPTAFDKNYTPLLQMNDPGEPPNKGAILTAPYGRGTYVYVTLALFRQLHNGVPGAARIFLNLVSATPAAPPRM